MNNLHLAVQFFIQLAVILLFCRLVGAIALRLGQPQVVAEMLAGVLLGPSLFGLLWPEAQHWLFPWDPTQKMRDTQSYLFPASQLGLALYMFVVGMEFRVDIVRRKLTSSIAVSVAGMLTPFVLGAGLAWILFDRTTLFPRTTSLSEAMLFLGASMCITAFPMLARIIHFKKLTGTTMGTVALGAGAIDDATAWCLLAVVLASFEKNWSHALVNITGGIAYVALTLLILRPLLLRAKVWLTKNGTVTDAGLVVGLAPKAMSASPTTNPASVTVPDWLSDSRSWPWARGSPTSSVCTQYSARSSWAPRCRAGSSCVILLAAFSRLRSRCCSRSFSRTRA